MKQESLSKLHSYELEILKELDRICNKYCLKYYLIGGTLLGAVRHKGFIPWDDDLDVVMPRDDYSKLQDLIKDELSSRFFYQSASTEKEYWKIFSKIRMNNTIFLEPFDKDNNINHGIFIDIFPLDCTNGRRGFYFRVKFKLMKVISYHIQNVLSFKPIPSMRFVSKLMGIIPVEKWKVIRDALLRGKGNYFVNYGSQYGIVKQTMPKDYYGNGKLLEFEGGLYNAPEKYELVLKSIYGSDFMERPPLEKRVTHNPLRLCFDTLSGVDEVL